jgi:hypothetical protein
VAILLVANPFIGEIISKTRSIHKLGWGESQVMSAATAANIEFMLYIGS